MFLRKLTDQEIERIKKAKDTANRAIKEQRKRLQAEIKQLEKLHQYSSQKFESLNQQLEALKVITGFPVIIKADNWSMFVNYTLLKKIESSLNRSDFWHVSLETKSEDRVNTLLIKYHSQTHKGQMEIYGLLRYQVELLARLPVISLDEVSKDE